MTTPIITGILDRLLANFFGHGKGGTPRRRGLFDALLTAMLLYAVYATTPLGAIVETAVNVALGQKSRPSWLATFDGRETEVHVSDAAVADATAATSALPAPIVAAAAKHGVDEEALAAMMSSDEACTATACLMAAPPRVATVLPALAGKEQLTADEAAQALVAAARAIGAAPDDPQLAIETLWLGPVPVKLAVEQARRSHLADPTDVEAHADFVAPSARRGPLQGALSVLAVYRLRTLAWPADRRLPITSRVGKRTHPITGLPTFHAGTDIGMPVGAAVLAAQRGGVKRKSRDSVCGNYLVLDHGLGIETVYCHLAQSVVDEGSRVRRKERIGQSGATGRVTGPHLHYVLKLRGDVMDAEQFGESPTRGAARAPVFTAFPAVPVATPGDAVSPAPTPAQAAKRKKPPPPPPPTTTTPPTPTTTTKAAAPRKQAKGAEAKGAPAKEAVKPASGLSPEARAALERLSRSPP